MSNRLLRFFMTGLLCLSFVGAAACGDDGGNNDQQCTKDDDCGAGEVCSDNECVLDLSCSDDSDCTNDGEICDADSGACVSGCRADDDCNGQICQDDNTCGPCQNDDDCSGDDICNNGVCEAPVAAQCTSVGEDCDPNADTADGFVCVNTGAGPKCYSQCTVPGDGETEPCQTGSFCNPLNSQMGDAGFCWASQCGDPTDSAGCQDIVDASPADYPNGATCLGVSNGAFLCIPAGDKAAGEDCSAYDDCEQGLSCFNGTCSAPCQGDSECSDGNTCVGDDDAFGGAPGWGFCYNGCANDGTTGQCGPDMGCFPVTQEDGICIEAGDTPAYGSCLVPTFCETDAECPGDDTCNIPQGQSSGSCEHTCSSNSDCDTGWECNIPEGETEGVCELPAQCEEGSRCLTLSDGTGRCLPTCDATPTKVVNGATRADQDAMDATCPTGNPMAAVRFVNLAQGSGEIDIYVNDTLTVDNRSPDSGAASAIDIDFTEMEAGDVTIDVTAGDAADNSSPMATLKLQLVMNDQKTFAIVNAPDGSGGSKLDILDVDVEHGAATPNAGEGNMSVAMDADLGTNVDVYIVDAGTLTIATETADFSDIAYGEATGFTGSMAAGDYDIYLVEAGTSPTIATALFDYTVTLDADTTATFHTWGVPNSSGSFDTLSADPVLYNEVALTSSNGFCYDLSSGEPRVNSGVCFERCTGPEAIGKGLCTNDADNCTTFGSNFVCLASAGNAVGDSCDPTALNDCEEGAFCRPLGNPDADGNPTGVCAKQCQPGGSLNDALQCPTEQGCESLGFEDASFGHCGFPCAPADAPSDYNSSDCTQDYLQSCPPLNSDENGDPTQAYCKASNDVAVGDACGSASANNCVPNAVCRGEASAPDYVSQLIDPARADNATCHRRCELFTDGASGCPSGQGCMVDGGTLSPVTGFCKEIDDSLSGIASLEPCPVEKIGMMCGDGSICAGNGSGGAMCFAFCDFATGDGCGDGETCTEFAGTIGICAAQ